MLQFPSQLLDRLWHSTTPRRYVEICETGSILPNPPLSETSRHGTAQGPAYYPYVRHLGGVSLFDFTDFDPVAYGKRCPMSDWHSFVPQNNIEGNQIWIEIDRNAVLGKLIDGPALTAKWEAEKAYVHKIMPYIEAAHVGPIPVAAFVQVLRFEQGSWVKHPPRCGLTSRSSRRATAGVVSLVRGL